jgi:S1-C subfamily serine protease
MLATALLLAAAPKQDLTADALYKRAVPSVAAVVTEKNGKRYHGTCFLAIKDGLAVTAWHVVDKATKVTLTFSDGEQVEATGLVDKDEQKDVAIISVKVAGRPLLPLASTEPDVGSKVFVIGTPIGFAFSISDGIVSQLRLDKGAHVIQTTAPISGGNSGGPLFDAKGEVAGVVAFGYDAAQNLNFAVASRHVRALNAAVPSTPWGKLRPGGDPVGAGSEPGPDLTPPKPPKDAPLLSDADAAAEILRIRMDANVHRHAWWDLFAEISTKKANEQILPPTAFKAFDGLFKLAHELIAFRCSDPIVSKAQVEAVEFYVYSAEAINMAMIAMIHAQRNGWDTYAKNKLSEAVGKWPERGAWGDSMEWLRKHTPESAKKKYHPQAVDFILAPPDFKGYVAFGLCRISLDMRYIPDLRVLNVDPKGPAGSAGLKLQDMIVSADDRHFASWGQFDEYLLSKAGKDVTLKVKRADGKEAKVKFKMPAKPPGL